MELSLESILASSLPPALPPRGGLIERGRGGSRYRDRVQSVAGHRETG